MTNFDKPMPLPPLPKLNIPDQEEVIDTPKIDLTPVDQPVVSDKPTEEQINSFKPLMWVAIATCGLIFFSWMQGSKTVSTEIRSAPATDTQSASTVPTEETPVVAPVSKSLPMPERDPDKSRLGILLLANLSDGKNVQDQLVEARASFHRIQAQTLSERNPQDYALYLAGQREKVNIALLQQVKTNQTTLVGTEDQIALASKLLIESQAITLEQLRLKVARGEMTDIPEELRSRLTPTAVSPYVRIAAFARDSDNIGTLDKINLLADREQELQRVAQKEMQNLQAAQNGKPVKPILPVPNKEAKK